MSASSERSFGLAVELLRRIGQSNQLSTGVLQEGIINPFVDFEHMMVGLVAARSQHPTLMKDLSAVLEVDPDLLATKIAEAQAELAARPKFGDHLLSKRGITVIEGARRGQSIPSETPLSALKPVGFLRQGDGRDIVGREMQKRALDKNSPCYAPWGRDLVWRIFNDQDGEGKVFLATLDKAKRYSLAGDTDLQESDGNQVVLCIYRSIGQWDWGYRWLTSGCWSADDRLFTLGNPSD